MTDHDFFPIRPSVRDALKPTCPEDADSLPEDERQWCSFWDCQCNWNMTKCNWELAASALFLGWFLIALKWTASLFLSETPAREDITSTTGMMVPYNHERSPKTFFFQHQMFFSKAWLDLFPPRHIWAYQVGCIREPTRIWEFEPGKYLTSTVEFHAELKWNWNSWCCSWSHSNSCKLS